MAQSSIVFNSFRIHVTGLDSIMGFTGMVAILRIDQLLNVEIAKFSNVMGNLGIKRVSLESYGEGHHSQLPNKTLNTEQVLWPVEQHLKTGVADDGLRHMIQDCPSLCLDFHDRNEEKCHVKVTLTSDCEDIPSVMFEAGGRRYAHACHEVAWVAIGELCDIYIEELVNTEYRYHPHKTHDRVQASYVDPEGIEDDATFCHVIELPWAMDETRIEAELATQDREDWNRGKIYKLQDKIDHLEKELLELKGEAPP
uniref:Retrotransposon protein, putative, Ty3-gypsy subclass n=2 Tax=Oryza sativa subsp. japonica TaxID=39947 RepID=Q84R05_ORYSJ|nr:putative gypsy-type retrotransposon protein [Oryza sativa Japonica Group]ABF96400.1 retrotransposon protein, putative, Ty3-gypsy subclass [Oryza sativa Japonica Group]